MKLVLSLLAVVGFASSLHAGSMDSSWTASPKVVAAQESWNSTYMIRAGVDMLAAPASRTVVESPAQKKDYSSLITASESSVSNRSAALTTGYQSGQGFSGGGIRSVR